jgi:hypothetical protein
MKSQDLLQDFSGYDPMKISRYLFAIGDANFILTIHIPSLIKDDFSVPDCKQVSTDFHGIISRKTIFQACKLSFFLRWMMNILAKILNLLD